MRRHREGFLLRWRPAMTWLYLTDSLDLRALILPSCSRATPPVFE